MLQLGSESSLNLHAKDYTIDMLLAPNTISLQLKSINSVDDVDTGILDLWVL